jgi:hypothetical protein
MIRVSRVKTKSRNINIRRVGHMGVALLAAAGLAVALAPSAAATGSWPSTTTVSASPSSSTAGTAVTLTAKVAAAVVGGVIITPSGTVSFTSTDGSSTTSLGTATLGSCLLSACTATLTTAAMPPGTTSVTGSYSGDGVVAPSSGSTAVTVTSPTVNGSSSTVTCPGGVFCDAGIITSSNGNGTMDTLASPSAAQQTVSESLDIGKTLHCPQNTDNQVGPLGAFSTTANDVTKTITYTGNGNVARSMLANYLAHPAFFGCYGSTEPFQGYVYGVYTHAAFVSSDGLYEAQPANCATNGNVKPCATESSTSKTTTYKLFTDMVSDPKLIG